MELDKAPIVFMITEGRGNDANYLRESERILKSIVSVQQRVSHIQIREKNLSVRLLLDLTEKAVAICEGKGTQVLVNERFDIALAAGASGVHLTSTSVPAEIVRSKCPKNFLIGVSTHSIEEARRAKEAGADYVFFGPVFETPSKAGFGDPKGLKELTDACNKLPGFPVIALGGINSSNLNNVQQAGAFGFGAIRMFASVD